MKKYIFFLVSLCCALLPAMADQPELLELKASDANIIGHVLDKKTGEHLSYITIALKGTTIGTVTDATGHYFLKNSKPVRWGIKPSVAMSVSGKERHLKKILSWKKMPWRLTEWWCRPIAA